MAVQARDFVVFIGTVIIMTILYISLTSNTIQRARISIINFSNETKGLDDLPGSLSSQTVGLTKSVTTPRTDVQKIPTIMFRASAVAVGKSVVAPPYNALKNFTHFTSKYCTNVCHMTTISSKADLVAFVFFELPDRPPMKYPEQMWLLWSHERQNFRGGASMILPRYNGLFNYTYSFKRNAPHHYRFSFYDRVKLPEKQTLGNQADILRKSQKGVIKPSALWLVSNCYTVTSGRTKYAQELSKYINITVVSRRIEQCQKKMPKLKIQRENGAIQLAQFTFYLAFENGLCTDYITEKLWKVFAESTPVIPVVLGGSYGNGIQEYTDITPPNSFIHVANFSSPEALAKHLRYVASNDDAISYYTKWREEWTVKREFISASNQCLKQVCSRLGVSKPKSVYTSPFENSNLLKRRVIYLFFLFTG